MKISIVLLPRMLGKFYPIYAPSIFQPLFLIASQSASTVPTPERCEQPTSVSLSFEINFHQKFYDRQNWEK